MYLKGADGNLFLLTMRGILPAQFMDDPLLTPCLRRTPCARNFKSKTLCDTLRACFYVIDIKINLLQCQCQTQQCLYTWPDIIRVDTKSHPDSRLRNVKALQVSGKNIFWTTLITKNKGRKIFEILHCPFEGRANLHHLCQPNGLVGWCQLGSKSKDQCTISKIIFPLLLYTFTEHNIFFPETCFAYPISEQKFTV